MRSQNPAIGIDLVEIKRAKLFYKEHKDVLGSFLRKEEARAVRESARPYETLAGILAAQEAVFKARGHSRKSVHLTVFKNEKYVVACALGHS